MTNEEDALAANIAVRLAENQLWLHRLEAQQQALSPPKLIMAVIAETKRQIEVDEQLLLDNGYELDGTRRS